MSPIIKFGPLRRKYAFCTDGIRALVNCFLFLERMLCGCGVGLETAPQVSLATWAPGLSQAQRMPGCSLALGLCCTRHHLLPLAKER